LNLRVVEVVVRPEGLRFPHLDILGLAVRRDRLSLHLGWVRGRSRLLLRHLLRLRLRNCLRLWRVDDRRLTQRLDGLASRHDLHMVLLLCIGRIARTGRGRCSR
jgi:hypothetical protein